MTTWSMDQIRQVSGLRAEVDVDMKLVERHGEHVIYEVALTMAKRVADMAHPFGVEIDPAYRDGFEVTWEKSPKTPWTARGRLRWNPSTQMAELRGGHLDGQRYAIREIGQPLRVPRLAATPWFDQPTEAIVEMADTYELVGWREGEHVWVYEA